MTLNKSFELGKLYTSNINLYVFPNGKKVSDNWLDPKLMESQQPFMVIAQNVVYYGAPYPPNTEVYSNTITVLIGKDEYKIGLYKGTDYDFKQLS